MGGVRMKKDAMILVACEESGTVTEAFLNLGFANVYSCDLLPTSGNYPEHHLQCDALELLKMQWDMILAFPPCTDLAVSGAKWFAEKQADGRQQRAIDFFLRFANADCPKIAIENPVGIMSTVWRKPDQIVQPWMFGHGETKNLPVAEGIAAAYADRYCGWQRTASLEDAAKT